MSTGAWLQLAVFMALLLALAWPLARWIDAVMAGRFALGRRLEGPLFKLAGVRPDEETGWLRYALGLLVFNGLGVLAVYALQRWQAVLPLNPQGMAAVSPDSAFNTAISFVTNTNWQGYGGESTMSYLTQMLALTVQNFLSAATGIVVVIALIRGFAARSAQGHAGPPQVRRLPLGGTARRAKGGPMTYVSPKTGKQYVVVMAGGHGSFGTRMGDSLVAWTLDEVAVR